MSTSLPQGGPDKDRPLWARRALMLLSLLKASFITEFSGCETE